MLKKPYGKELLFIKSASFPKTKPQKTFPYRALIGIGGNVGDVIRRFEHLLVAMERDRRMAWHQSSRILKNPPFGFSKQPYFYNAVLSISTKLLPHELLRVLLRLEDRFGRKRSFKNAPRTLDIDILFFNGQSVNKKDLIIPHPHWRERDSVLLPLADLGLRL